MAKLLCEFDRHHNSEQPRWKAFVASEEAALHEAVQQAYGIEWTPEQARELFLKAKRDGGANLELEVDGEPDYLFCWYIPSYKTGKLNFGVGQGRTPTDTDPHKFENVWIYISEWTPDPKRLEQLEMTPKEDLIDTVLELEALK